MLLWMQVVAGTATAVLLAYAGRWLWLRASAQVSQATADGTVGGHATGASRTEAERQGLLHGADDEQEAEVLQVQHASPPSSSPTASLLEPTRGVLRRRSTRQEHESVAQAVKSRARVRGVASVEAAEGQDDDDEPAEPKEPKEPKEPEDCDELPHQEEPGKNEQDETLGANVQAGDGKASARITTDVEARGSSNKADFANRLSMMIAAGPADKVTRTPSAVPDALANQSADGQRAAPLQSLTLGRASGPKRRRPISHNFGGGGKPAAATTSPATSTPAMEEHRPRPATVALTRQDLDAQEAAMMAKMSNKGSDNDAIRQRVTRGSSGGYGLLASVGGIGEVKLKKTNRSLTE